MTDLRSYWAGVRALREKLPAVVFLASVASPENGANVDGRVSECVRETAARKLADGTHRVATDTEIDAFFALQEANLNDSERQERRRARRFTKLIDDDPPTKAPVRPAA